MWAAIWWSIETLLMLKLSLTTRSIDKTSKRRIVCRLLIHVVRWSRGVRRRRTPRSWTRIRRCASSS